MKYIPLVWAGMWRKPLRTVFTFLSIAVAFILFGILSGVDAGFAHTLEVARLDRLFTDSRFGAPMPLAYAEQIARVPGVTLVAPRWGLIGYFQDPKNGMGVIGTDERFFGARPELAVSKDQIDALLRLRTGAVVGVFLAKKYGWKVGDKIPLQSNTATVDGGKVWTFDIVAIVEDVDHPGQAGYFIANYKYLDERRVADKGTIDRYLVRIKDPNRATEISRAIDKLFANSTALTRTTSEKSQAQAGLQSLGDINFFTDAIVGAVLFMLLFLTGNTMMQSVRERVPEFAVLKTLGFSDTGVLILVFAELVLLCVLAGLAGLAFAKVGIPLVKSYFPDVPQLIQMPWAAIVTGLGFALMVAFISGLIPALRARRLNIVDALAGR